MSQSSDLTNRGGIYVIRNLVNGRQYIGQASSFVNRFQHHRYMLRKGRHANQRLQRSYNRHGAEAFAFEVLEIVEDFSTLTEREQYWLDCLPHEYNIAPVAGSLLGHKRGPRTPEHTAKITEQLRGRPTGRAPSQEQRQRLIEWQRRAIAEGRYRRSPHSPETRAKIGAANRIALRGKTLSDAHKARLSATNKGVPWSAARRAAEPPDGRKMSPEAVEKSAAARRGQKRTPEMRERMRQAALRRHRS